MSTTSTENPSGDDDTAVPPERVAEQLAGLIEVVDEHLDKIGAKPAGHDGHASEPDPTP